MKILTKDTCPSCNGDKRLPVQIWIEFYTYDRKTKIETGRYRTAEEMRAWFTERGYSPGLELPQEEVTCTACEGKGEIEKWMNLAEILNPLRKT